MKRLYRDNVAFAYEDVGSGSQPFLFVHGWTCNHNFFAPQIEYFSRFHRVIAADLCGHGASDAPQRQYTVPEFADDLAWLCGELGVERAVLVGHSMGGVIALQLAATHPELSAGVCLIDSVVFPSDAFIAQLKLLGDQLAGAAYIQTLQLAAGALFIETDDPVRKAHVLAEMAKTSQHVAVPAFRNHLLDYDASRAARACRVPIAYIAASNLMADLAKFKQLCPQLVTAQTIGSGHFSLLEVPEQVNAMLERFVKISLPGRSSSIKPLRKLRRSVVGRHGGDADGRVASAESARMPRQNCGARTCVVTGPHARERRTTSRGRHRGGVSSATS